MRVNKRRPGAPMPAAWALFGTLLVAGCSAGSFGRPAPSFPPQAVMEHGDYATFVAASQQRLKACEDDSSCARALFNLGFAYAYPPSPYHDPARALVYLSQLVDTYPRSAWAFQGQAWTALLNQTLSLQAEQRRLQAVLRAQAAAIDDLQGQLQRSRDIDLRIDQIQAALRAQAATIRNLEGQLKRSRDIDLRIDQKERELLR